MNILPKLSSKFAFFPNKPKVLPIKQIFLLSEITNQTFPSGILELSKLAQDQSETVTATGLVISADLVQDFWQHQGLDKKIKNIISTVNLRHPRSISAAAAEIERLIRRQSWPESWLVEWKKISTVLTSQVKSEMTVSLYFGNSQIGQIDWLSESTGIATESVFGKLVRQSLVQLYSERFIREREQRGFGQAHFPITILVTFHPITKTTKTAPVVAFSLITNARENVARFTLQQKDEVISLCLFKPALNVKKNVILNAWNQNSISEQVLVDILAPLVDIEKRTNQSVSVTGYLEKARKKFTISRLEISRPQPVEITLEYILRNTGPVLGTGKFFGSGIAVGPLAVQRTTGRQTIEPGSIVVAKNLSSVTDSMITSAAGLVLEDNSQNTEIKLRTLHVTIPVLLGAKQATKRLRSGTIVTLASVDTIGTLFAGALHYEVKPSPLITKKIKTELRLPDSVIALDDLLCEIGNRHPMDYFGSQKSSEYSDVLGQKLAEAVAQKYPTRVIVELSNSLPAVFAAWNGGAKAERKLHLRQSARGAERYLHPQYAAVLAAECNALKQARERFGLTNFAIQLPYCRSGHELEEMLTALKKQGISREQNWRFVLATDVPGHALLTQSLAEHLDELVFNIDALVKSTTGERATTMTPVIQKTVETALAAIAKTAAKEQARIALTGSLLSRQPKLVYAAIKSGVKALVVNEQQSVAVRNAVYEAERSVGNTVGTNPQLLGMVAGFACLGALLVTVGAGCGQNTKLPETPQMTPAQIRAEILTALAEEREKALTEDVTATVSGFANFRVIHPRAYEASYSPTDFVLLNQGGGEMLTFTALNKFGTSSSTDFVTDTNLSGKLFTYAPPESSSSSPLYIYEIELGPKKILKIESSTKSLQIEKIIKSIKPI